MVEAKPEAAAPAYPSAIQATYERLRAHLVTGALPPGEKLKIKVLSERYDVSQGAVREALSRLSAEGLVIAEPQRGFRVSPVSIEELADLTAVRIELESRCLARSIEHGDLAWESRIVAAMHRLSRMPRGHRDGVDSLPGIEWEDAHADFHDALVSACTSPWLLSLRKQLYAQSERYRLLAASHIEPSRDLGNEHDVIVQAVLSRDVEQSIALVRKHLSSTVDNLLRTGGDIFGMSASVDVVRARPRRASILSSLDSM
ncbi:GntR family transcriptional regulator [Paraburkholderia tropica]|uniref:GntR family transcriptional regulator n=1 Tax=Paraburkholderia tropica TaxID=92647 RepID=UPI0007EC6458|nr:FCD domain-containing protein [Paraburkholderia tropica]